MADNMTFLLIASVITFSSLFNGLCVFRIDGDGGSVDNANTPMVSIIMLIQSNWEGVKGLSPLIMEPTNMRLKITKFIVTCNYTNFLTLEYIALPHMRAYKIDSKLSSSRTISEASLLTSLYILFPKLRPTSANFKAFTSFMPDPVIATISFSFRPMNMYKKPKPYH